MKSHRRLTTLLAATIALVPLAGCGGAPPSDTTDATDITVAQEAATAEGYDLLGGTWEVGAITYKGKVVRVDAVEALADLYDNEFLGFSSDGTFERHLNVFVTRGTYEPYEGERTFLLRAESSARLTIEDGKMTETEPEESDKVYLLVMADHDDNTCGFVEFDPMTGKAKAGESPLYFVKSGQESTALGGSTSTSTTSGTSDGGGSSSPTGYAAPKDDTSGSTGTTTTSPRATSPTTTHGGNQKAIDRAGQYLSTMPFSYEGLIAQLEYEGFSHDDATYAADVCGANWEVQALLKAQQYLGTQAFSQSGLVRQLEFEKFTSEEARYGAQNCGADWNEQAVLKAREYQRSLSLSGSRLVEQLEFEGFTHAQAVYGVEHA